VDSRAGVPATTRLFLLAGVALLWAALILCRLFYLQVVCHRSYREQAENQQLKRLELPAPRGVIVDRSGRPLAMSLQADSVCINPRLVPDRTVAAEILARILGLDRNALFDKIQWAFEHRRGFLWVKRKLTPSESTRLKSLGLDWISFRTESHRFYPKGALGAHLIGAVDFEEKGNLGLEYSLDGELRGRDGLARVLTDVKQRGIESQVFAEPEPGRNIALTIDERIQFIAERELKAAAEANRCKAGSVVVMDPHNGEILAMANHPGFDPNRPPQPGEDPSVRFNQAVSVPFEPGSVFKVITVSAALETTRLQPGTIIPCGGGRINLFGRVIHDHDPYGALTLADVLAKSSNIGAIQIALKAGDRNMLECIRRFGFGKPTGIPLPAESAGTVRELKLWSKSSIGSVAMGHEVSATTLQLAQAASVIASGGLLVKPRLILWRQRPGGPAEKARSDPPVRVLKPETAITMRQLMEGVVLRGTGKKARLNGYTAGGKTGTAQIFDRASGKYTHFYNASFVGFAPVTSPAIVVAVTLNGARKYGGVVAAPVFRHIALETLRLLDVPKDLPEGLFEADKEPVEENDLAIADLGSPAPPPLPPVPVLPVATPAQPSNAVAAFGPTVPGFQGKTMRAVFEEALALGLPVEIIGTGVARGQAPPPGSLLPAGQKIRVQFAP